MGIAHAAGALLIFLAASAHAADSFVGDAMVFCSALQENYAGFYIKTGPTEMTKKDFARACDLLIKREMTEPAASRQEFFRRLMRLASKLHDGHLGIRDSDGQTVWHAGLGFSLIEKKTTVIINEGGPAEVEVGDVVTAVDGRPPLEFQDFPALSLNRRDYADVVKSAFLTVFLSPDQPDRSEVAATFRSARTGKSYQATLRFRQGKPPFLPKTLTSLSRPEDKSGAVIWRINSFSMNAKSAILADLKTLREWQTKNPATLDRLVIDLRTNPGGTTQVGNSLFSLFNPKDQPAIKLAYRFPCSDSIRAKLETIFRSGCPDGASPHYSSLVPLDWMSDHDEDFDQFKDLDFSRTNIVLLVSPVSFSTTEDFSMLMKLQKRATIIGETTGGGGTVPLISRQLTTSHLQLAVPSLVLYLGSGDGEMIEYEAKGVSPHIHCQPRPADIVNHHDRCLAHALKFLR